MTLKTFAVERAVSVNTAQLAETLLSSLSEGIVVLDEDLRYLVWNPYIEAITGLPAQEVLGKRALELFPHFLEQKFDRYLYRALAGQRVTTPDYRYRVPASRREGWAVSTYAPHRDAEGKVVGVVALVSDISERKQAEVLELHRSHFLEMVARNTPLEQTLTVLAKAVETQFEGAWCSLSLVQDGLTRYLAAPNLPAEIVAATDRTPAELWESVSEGAGALHSVASVWTIPIPVSATSAVAQLTLWFKRQFSPTQQDRSQLAALVRLAAVALEQHHLLERLTHQATHDPLTGLPNRFSFEQRLCAALERARDSGKVLAVLIFDLDRFKTINDTLGHQAGDALLKAVAERLGERTRQSDLLARLGGDEFALILEKLRSPEVATRVAQSLLAILAEPFVIGERELFVTASIGVSLYPEDGEDASTLLSNVDSAMYQAKAQGKNRFHSFLPGLNAEAARRLELETHLRRALERQELHLHYQPKVSLPDQRLVGFEALLRWRHADLGHVSPADFIPIAEESGLIVEIGRWVLQAACKQARCWQRSGRSVPVAVNVSALQFSRSDFVAAVKDALTESGLEPRLLELELTESTVMSDTELGAKRLAELRALGVRVALDDFGTGYCSMAYLRRLPFDTLKIDRSFIRDMLSEDQGGALVEAIVRLAHSLRLEVVAEGVESEAQLSLLQRFGCDTAQGFYFARPLPADEVRLAARAAFSMSLRNR